MTLRESASPASTSRLLPTGDIYLPATERPNWQRRIWARRNPQYRDGMIGLALLAGPANVVMQLARPGVGYGVMESKVESGRIDLHPIKRARTTFTYLAVAARGTDSQKAAYRKAVDTSHAQVRSTADSPVKYNAFDRNLQLWVAACLYKGGVDIWHTFIGEMDEATADAHYRSGMTLGTTLQVPPEMWPADRAAFEQYWNEALDQVHIDEAVRKYLYRLISRPQLPRPLVKPAGVLSVLLTTGFLPQRFRDEMQLPWDARRQAIFDRIVAGLRVVVTVSPRMLREFPFNALMMDLDRRIRTGRPLV
ncbi:MAG: oxygenase MpaB family protein [Mycobacterium sp.]